MEPLRDDPVQHQGWILQGMTGLPPSIFTPSLAFGSDGESSAANPTIDKRSSDIKLVSQSQATGRQLNTSEKISA